MANPHLTEEKNRLYPDIDKPKKQKKIAKTIAPVLPPLLC